MSATATTANASTSLFRQKYLSSLNNANNKGNNKNSASTKSPSSSNNGSDSGIDAICANLSLADANTNSSNSSSSSSSSSQSTSPPMPSPFANLTNNSSSSSSSSSNSNSGNGVFSSMQHAAAAAGVDSKCTRCGGQVYALERIGPIKGAIYHRTCFKCSACERQLDLKTYRTNQQELSDAHIYCGSHAPKSGKGVFGADSVAIHNMLHAPKLDLMQKVDNKPRANIDGSARHIMHAMHAQHLLQANGSGTKGRDGHQLMTPHGFPAYPFGMASSQTAAARQAVRKAQEALEAKQRVEEDRLLEVCIGHFLFIYSYL